jgi:hypothetical protein
VDEEGWWIRGDASCPRRVKRVTVIAQSNGAPSRLSGLRGRERPKRREGRRGTNPKGVAWVSREIRCGSGGSIPWGAGDTISVKIVSGKRERGRRGVIPTAGQPEVQARNLEGRKAQGGTDVASWLNPRTGGSGSGRCAQSLDGQGVALRAGPLHKSGGTRRSRGRTAPRGDQHLEGRTPRAGSGWNKPERSRGEQSVERVRNPGGATGPACGNTLEFSSSARLRKRCRGQNLGRDCGQSLV